MGTRADFYVGCGHDAEWLGSVAWDGYEWAEDGGSIMEAKTESEFRKAVAELSSRDDWTLPEKGWPWPWKTSATTDYVYYFLDGEVWWASFDDSHDWPDMTDRQNVALGERSGVILVRRGGENGEGE